MWSPLLVPREGMYRSSCELRRHVSRPPSVIWSAGGVPLVSLTFFDLLVGLRLASPAPAARMLGSRSWLATPDLPIPPPAARFPPLLLALGFEGLLLRLETS